MTGYEVGPITRYLTIYFWDVFKGGYWFCIEGMVGEFGYNVPVLSGIFWDVYGFVF